MLEQILSGEATENVVENIHEYLTTVGENVRAGKIKLEEFIVYKVRYCLAYRVVPSLISCAAFGKEPRGLS